MFSRLKRAFSYHVYYLLKGCGRDRLGIASDVAEVIASYQGIVAESRMVSVAGEFGLVMLAWIGTDKPEVTRLELERKMMQYGIPLSIKIKEMKEEDEVSKTDFVQKNDGYYNCSLMLRSGDNPQVLFNTLHFLTNMGIKMSTMHTTEEFLHVNGTFFPRRRLEAEINVPSIINFDSLATKITDFEKSETVSITLKRTERKEVLE